MAREWRWNELPTRGGLELGAREIKRACSFFSTGVVSARRWIGFVGGAVYAVVLAQWLMRANRTGRGREKGAIGRVASEETRWEHVGLLMPAGSGQR